MVRTRVAKTLKGVVVGWGHMRARGRRANLHDFVFPTKVWEGAVAVVVRRVNDDDDHEKNERVRTTKKDLEAPRRPSLLRAPPRCQKKNQNAS